VIAEARFTHRMGRAGRTFVGLDHKGNYDENSFDRVISFQVTER